MNIYELIKLRKSVRSYQKKDVTNDVLMRLLEAARMAPSAKNLQEWRFIVVRDENTKNKLMEAAKGQKFVGEAPVVLVCCADTDNHQMTCGQLCYPIDLAIAIDHITLCAVAEGLGTCWIGAFYEDKVKKILQIPDSVRVVELLPIGYPTDPSPKEKNRLPMDKIVMNEHWN